eukprot:c16139_g1_i2.p1 GENE.c16139_g1_i2~~c16139_g1_i2.p1  ORF type:complete len:397 (-),score=65.73 c16139_g1_i2:28-1218(-)
MRFALVALLVTLCASEPCPNNCEPHGICLDNACHCFDGYTGVACDVSTTGCPDHCSAHGDCLNGQCDCDVGFRGERCESISNACGHLLNCTGHGKCVKGACQCDKDWDGPTCDKNIAPWECPPALHNCSENGRCGAWTEGSTEWTCACQPGFCGDHCNTVCPLCPLNCTGHGICTSEGLCECYDGYKGSSCSRVVEKAGCPRFCSGRGDCEEGVCVCESGWHGADCSISEKACPNECNKRGVCIDHVCSCVAGFTGEGCTIETTCLNNCSALGTCLNGECKCHPGYAGADCSRACRSECSGHGNCLLDQDKPTCYCDIDHYGYACEWSNEGKGLASISDGSPVVTAIIAVMVVGIIAMVGGYAYNFTQGKRGYKAIPGYSLINPQSPEETAGYVKA